MKNVAKKVGSLVLLSLFILLPTISFCQPDLDDPEVDAPIDGGITLLLAAGIGLGIKKVKQNNKAKI
jgi:hypothetical protein